MAAEQLPSYRVGQLMKPTPWWDEEPSRWMNDLERKECVVGSYFDLAHSVPKLMDTPSQYVYQIFRNNYNTTMNLCDTSCVWKVLHSAATNYVWKDGSVPRCRRYTLTFRRSGFLDGIADYMTGIDGNLAVECQEIAFGDCVQLFVEPKGEWGKVLRPLYIKLIVTVTLEFWDSLTLHASVFYVPNSDASWAIRYHSQPELVHRMVEWLSLCFKKQCDESSSKMI